MMLTKWTCLTLALTLPATFGNSNPRPESILFADGPVPIEVLAIRATTNDTVISPELRDLAKKLRSQFKFTGYKLEKRAALRAAVGQAANSALVGGYAIEVTPKSNDGKRVELQIRILQGKRGKLNTTVTVNARCHQFIGGMNLGDGDELIVGVSAQ